MKKMPENARNPIASAPVDPPPHQPDDPVLYAAVTRSLEMDGRIARESIRVAVRDGCAILTGTVSTEYQRVLADAFASAVPGVLVVKNQLAVSQKGPMAKTPE